MKIRLPFCLLVSLVASLPALCAQQVVGEWIVKVEKDPFSSKAKSMAMTASSGVALAIRCFPEDGLSAILITGDSTKSFDPGDKPQYKYRADEGEIVDLQGEAFGESSIDLPNAPQILKDAQQAKELYFRIGLASNTVATLTFQMRGAAKALQKIQADCGSTADISKPTNPPTK